MKYETILDQNCTCLSVEHPYTVNNNLWKIDILNYWTTVLFSYHFLYLHLKQEHHHIKTNLWKFILGLYNEQVRIWLFQLQTHTAQNKYNFGPQTIFGIERFWNRQTDIFFDVYNNIHSHTKWFTIQCTWHNYRGYILFRGVSMYLNLKNDCVFFWSKYWMY